jgi:O-antigen ligase
MSVGRAEKTVLGRLLALTCFSTTVMILPTTAFDPINVPKLFVIALGGFMAAGALFTQKQILFASKYRIVQIFSLAFVCDLLLVLLVSGTNFTQEFFGTFGRATGFLAYVSLTFLLISAVLAADSTNLSRVSWSLIASGSISMIYGLLQAANADPFDWTSSYNPVIGFLGNPNFQSSFLGFTSVLAFSLALSKRLGVLVRGILAIDSIFSIYVISSTDSQQGFFVAFLGLVTVFLIWVIKSKLLIFRIPALISSVFAVALLGLGSINKGPLASLLFKPSVTYRGDYWLAGWKMTIDHPFLGVGLDSYGDWYRRARSVEATLRRGPDVTSNSAHNVLLDLSSNGGFPLLLIYLFMLLLVVFSSIKVIRRTQGFDPVFVGLLGVWVAYQAQSIISLNQIGLAVWGWVISGLLIGYEINSREDSSKIGHNKARDKSKLKAAHASKKIGPAFVVGIFVGGCIGLTLGVAPLQASSRYLAALKSKETVRVQQAAYIAPIDASNMYRVTQILVNNEMMSRALSVSNDSIEKFKDDYAIWAIRSKIIGLSKEQMNEALAQMKRLDPYNPDLK